MFNQLKSKARALTREIDALYLVARDPRTPWYAKMIVTCVVAYARSPIDLIPDFIPVLGYLDDLVLLPVGIYLALKLSPPVVIADARQRAAAINGQLPKCWSAAILIVAVWIAAAILLSGYLVKILNTETQSLIGA
jgi:uncharacterized membrane protein YkvA (DUF1232 family)